MRIRNKISSLLWLLAAATVQSALTAASAEDACNNGTWANCGLAVKQELDRSPNVDRVIALGTLWGKAFDTQFDNLRKQHRVERAVPDSEKIYEAIKSKIDPLDIVTDRAREAAIKRFLPRLEFVVKWASGPIGAALQAFFTPSDIATDYDELRLMNDQLQEQMLNVLRPSLRPNWNDQLKSAVQSAAPQLRMP